MFRLVRDRRGADGPEQTQRKIRRETRGVRWRLCWASLSLGAKKSREGRWCTCQACCISMPVFSLIADVDLRRRSPSSLRVRCTSLPISRMFALNVAPQILSFFVRVCRRTQHAVPRLGTSSNGPQENPQWVKITCFESNTIFLARRGGQS